MKPREIELYSHAQMQKEEAWQQMPSQEAASRDFVLGILSTNIVQRPPTTGNMWSKLHVILDIIQFPEIIFQFKRILLCLEWINDFSSFLVL